MRSVLRALFFCCLGMLGAAQSVAAQGSDLFPDGSLLIIDTAVYEEVDILVNVVNVGTAPAYVADGLVRFEQINFPARTQPHSSSSDPNAILPGERGYINVPGFARQSTGYCFTTRIEIDASGTLQNAPNARANDSRTAQFYDPPGQCPLHWSGPINAATFAEPFDMPEAVVVFGKSIEDIVSSREVGRSDGQRCSACHYTGATPPYAPSVAANGISDPLISPLTLIGGERWVASSNPWVSQFLKRPDLDYEQYYGAKAVYLKRLFRKWLQDGARQ